MLTDRIDVSAAGLPIIETEPPAEFGGSGERWSPETLLIAAVADWFLLTFKAVARASKFEFDEIQCEVEGTLDRVDGITKFTKIMVRPTLVVRSDELIETATKLLIKSEKNCLVSNSLSAEIALKPKIKLALAG
jgi:peroxiredoxin-like protein